ncbi:glyoxalase [bacterium]|nr:MAG: glyoxalase [bacterium]
MITGFHHLTAISSNAARTVDYYTRVLGLKMVKQTVNFDDPGAWHLYFGDRTGRPGTILTFFEWAQLQRGLPGIGGTHHVALRVPDKTILLKWKRRLNDLGYHVNGPFDRNYFESIYTTDPDGLIIELATDGPGFTIDEPFESLGEAYLTPASDKTKEGRDAETISKITWPDPVPEITPDMKLDYGMHHISAISSDIERTDDFYQDVLGMRRIKRTKNYDDGSAPHWYWSNQHADLGSVMTYFEYKPGTYRQVKMGTGMTHHIAFSVPDNETQMQMYEKLRSKGYRVSPFMDRTYFRSIYFNDPDGHILEIATEGPGFSFDEKEEELGTNLMLPKQFEQYRSQIEQHLSPLK